MFWKFFILVMFVISTDGYEVPIQIDKNKEMDDFSKEVIFVFIKYTIKSFKVEEFPLEVTEIMLEKWICVNFIKILQRYFFSDNYINRREMTDILRLLLTNDIYQNNIVSTKHISSAFFIQFLKVLYFDVLSDKFLFTLKYEIKKVAYLTDELLQYIKRKDVSLCSKYIREKIKARFKIFLKNKNYILKKDEKTYWKFNEKQFLIKVNNKKTGQPEEDAFIFKELISRVRNSKISYILNSSKAKSKETFYSVNEPSHHVYEKTSEINYILDEWNKRSLDKKIIEPHQFFKFEKKDFYCPVGIKNNQKDVRKDNIEEHLYDIYRPLSFSKTHESDINDFDPIEYGFPKHSNDRTKYKYYCKQDSDLNLANETTKIRQNSEILKDDGCDDSKIDSIKMNKGLDENVKDIVSIVENRRSGILKKDKGNKFKKNVSFNIRDEFFIIEKVGNNKKLEKAKKKISNKKIYFKKLLIAYFLIPDKLIFEKINQKYSLYRDNDKLINKIRKEGTLVFDITNKDNFVLFILNFFERLSNNMQKIIKIEIVRDNRSISIYYSMDDIFNPKMAVLDGKLDHLIQLYEKGKFRHKFVKKLKHNLKNTSYINEIIKCIKLFERPEEEKKVKSKGSIFGSFGRMFTRKKPEKEIIHSLNDNSNNLIKSIKCFEVETSDIDLRSSMDKISKWSNSANDIYSIKDLGEILDNLLCSSIFQHEHTNDFRDIIYQNSLLKMKLDYLQTEHKEISKKNIDLIKTICTKFDCLPDFTVILMNYFKKYAYYKRPIDIELVIYKFLIDYSDLNEFDIYSMTIYQLNYYCKFIVKDIINDENARELANLITRSLSFNKVQHCMIREICKNTILTEIISSNI